MKGSALLILSLLSVCALASEEYVLSELPTFQIDLDMEPQERFKEVVAYHKEAVTVLVNYYLRLMPSFVEDIFARLEDFLKVTQHEHYLEIKGISEVLEIPMSQALFLNYIYELQAFCTSIVARSSDGTVVHSRNLDFPNSDDMRDITFIAEYMKDGKVLFNAVQFAGTIGIYTGLREGAFSVSENDRQTAITVEKIAENLELMFKGYNEVSWLVRDVLATCEDFECALNNFMAQPLITPAYLIVAGVKEYEGAVISRDRFGTAHVDMLSADRWYVAQTNDDHFTGACQGRCQTAHANLDALGSEMLTRDNIREEIMFKGPTLNDHSIFNSVMVPGDGFFDAIGTDSQFPDEP